MSAPKIQGLVLFEVYEANGALLVVTSALSDVELSPTDKVYRRPWATSAPAEDAGPKHWMVAANCHVGGPGAPISSGLVCRVCPPLPNGALCVICGSLSYPLGDPCSTCGGGAE